MNKLNYIYIYEYLDKIKYSLAFRHNLLKKLLPIYLRFGKSKPILFIFGVQRSGTSITFHTFRKFFGVKAYDEFSELSEEGDEQLRFPSYAKVKKIINNNLEPYIINKPLVESQVADKVLENFDNAVGIWMYRNYKDVVSSFHKKFGETIGKHHLDLIITGKHNNWRAERVPEKFKQLAIDLEKKGLSNQDSTALYWCIRNSIYFEYHFNNIANLKLIKYEYFMENPMHFISKICKLWGYTYPIAQTQFNFNTDSINRGVFLNLQPEIEALCENLSKKLDKEFEEQAFFKKS